MEDELEGDVHHNHDHEGPKRDDDLVWSGTTAESLHAAEDVWDGFHFPSSSNPATLAVEILKNIQGKHTIRRTVVVGTYLL